ncbi:hypothetical protein CsSME_00050184 [Camellia sinensis var. sinensis]
MSLLITSLLEEILPLVVGLSSSHVVWSTLEALLASPSNTHIRSLRMTLQQLRQEDASVSSYLHHAKVVFDELIVASHPLALVDFNIYVFKGLRPEFKDLVTTIAAQLDPVLFAELHNLLLSHEFINNNSLLLTVTSPP